MSAAANAAATSTSSTTNQHQHQHQPAQRLRAVAHRPGRMRAGSSRSMKFVVMNTTRSSPAATPSKALSRPENETPREVDSPAFRCRLRSGAAVSDTAKVRSFVVVVTSAAAGAARAAEDGGGGGGGGGGFGGGHLDEGGVDVLEQHCGFEGSLSRANERQRLAGGAAKKKANEKSRCLAARPRPSLRKRTQRTPRRAGWAGGSPIDCCGTFESASSSRSSVRPSDESCGAASPRQCCCALYCVLTVCSV